MSKAYFKATRIDGRDFHSGTLLYEVGRTVRPHKTDLLPRICGPGYLHASDVTGEVLIGGSWPCRLFEVTGKPHAGFNSEHKHKGGFRQLKVEREIDPYLALGPNGRYVAGIIERSRKLTTDDFDKLYASWAASWAASRAASWAASRDASWAASWDASWAASRDASWAASWAASRAASWAASRDASRAASRAAVALQSSDLITPDQFKILYEVWGNVFGKPKMAPKWKGPGHIIK